MTTQSVAAYGASLAQFPRLPRDAERELVRAYRAGDVEAGKRVIEANLLPTYRIARGFARRRTALDHAGLADLVADANLTLVTALPSYEPESPARFLTYAYPRIAGACLRALDDYGPHATIRVPLHARSRYRVATTDLMAARDVAATDDALADDAADTTGRLGTALERLDAREAQLVSLLAGLTGDPLTLTQAAAVIGVGRTRAGQLRDRAFERLRGELLRTNRKG